MAKSVQDDLEQFKNVLQLVNEEFENNPHTYPNEETAVVEVYSKLRKKLSPSTNPATMESTNVSNNIGEFDVRSERVPRVRPEISFYDGEDPKWEHDDGMVWCESNRPHPFDLAIFSKQPLMKMRTRKTGPGNWWDLQSNKISILAEFKHSKANDQVRFFAKNSGVKDIRRLSNTNGKIENRVFVFFDLLYRGHSDNSETPHENFDELTKELISSFERISKQESLSLSNVVDVFYIPRIGKLRHIKVKGKEVYEWVI